MTQKPEKTPNEIIATNRAVHENAAKPHVAPPGGNAPRQITKAEAIAAHNYQPVPSRLPSIFEEEESK
jgi:hypothetical protein